MRTRGLMRAKPSMDSVNWPASLEFFLPGRVPLTHPGMAAPRASHPPTSTQLQVPVQGCAEAWTNTAQLSPAPLPRGLCHSPDCTWKQAPSCTAPNTALQNGRTITCPQPPLGT